MPIHKRGELQVIAEDEDGPILSAVRVNGVPWLYVYCTSMDMSHAGKGYNLVSMCKDAAGTWVVAATIQAGLCDDRVGLCNGDIDISPIIDGKLGRVMGWIGKQGPYGPGMICDAPNYWEIGSNYAPFKLWV